MTKHLVLALLKVPLPSAARWRGNTSELVRFPPRPAIFTLVEVIVPELFVVQTISEFSVGGEGFYAGESCAELAVVAAGAGWDDHQTHFARRVFKVG